MINMHEHHENSTSNLANKPGAMPFRKIKVAFVTNHNLRFVGGGEKVLLNYLRYAPSDRFDITVFQSDYDAGGDKLSGPLEEALKKVEVITVKAYQSKLYIFSRNRIALIISILVFYPFLNFILRNIIYRKQISRLKGFDVIYFFQNEMSSLFSRAKSKLIGSNHSSMSRESPLLTEIVSRLIGTGMLYHKIDGVHLFPSSAMLMPKLSKVDNLILTNGVDTSTFRPPEITSMHGRIKILYVARLEPYKGIMKLLKMWDMIKGCDRFELHIAGDGPLADLVRKKAGGALHYHGSLSHDRLSVLYRDSDIFVTTTEMDTFGLVVLEALSSGLHVLASEFLRGTFDEFEASGDLEYVKNRPDYFAQALKNAADNIENIRLRKQALHDYVKENYDWKVVTDKLFRFFETISAD